MPGGGTSRNFDVQRDKGILRLQLWESLQTIHPRRTYKNGHWILEVTLAIPAASLKEKRGVIKRILNRSRNQFNVSAAEVEAQDHLNSGVIGFSTVGNDARYTAQQTR